MNAPKSKYRIICALALVALMASAVIVDHAYRQHVRTMKKGDDVGLSYAKLGLGRRSP